MVLGERQRERQLALDELPDAWAEAGLASDALSPVLDAIEAGFAGATRAAGEAVWSAVLVPRIEAVYVQAKTLSATDTEAIAALDTQRHQLAVVCTLLRQLRAVDDIPAREPRKTIEAIVAQRAGVVVW